MDAGATWSPAGQVTVPPATVDVERLRGALIYRTYRGLATGIGRAPGPVADGVAAVIGTVLAYRKGGSLALRERHIRRVLVDGARVSLVSNDAVHRGMQIGQGYDYLKSAMAAGKGVVLALPHVGGWEWGGRYLAIDGMPMTTVAERVEPPALYDWFVGQRRAMTLTVVALGDEGSGQVVMKALRDGKLVGLLCDRDLAGNGIGVEFFGERTTMPAGPATLALRTGAALLVAVVFLGPRGQHLGVISSPIDTSRQGTLRQDVARITQDLARHFEDHIRQAPEQWHMYQPIWPSDRDG
jgi:phosphatidylinositol dimannoside acyltransferase